MSEHLLCDCGDYCHESKEILKSEIEKLKKNRDFYQAKVYQQTVVKLAQKERDEMKTENARLREALERCIGWMEPILDGFGIKETAESRVSVLDFAKSALGQTETK